MIDTKALRSRILDLAIQGKLTEQLESDGTAEELYQLIQAEKQKLIKEGKIKKEKPLPEITADEIPFEIPSNWKWVKLSNIGTTNIGLTYHPSDVVNNGTIVIRSSNIINGKMDYSDIVKVNCSIKDNQYVNKNDIVICARNGSKALVGKNAIYDGESGKVAFGAFMAIFRTEYYAYVHLFFNTQTFRRYFSSDDSKQINQVTQAILKNSIIPLPPLAEQKRIVERVEEIFRLLDTIDKAQEKYAADSQILKAKLITAGIQGKLTKQLESDGTAHELYQQIQEEKQKLIKEGKIKKEKPLPPISHDEIPFEIPQNWMWVRLGMISSKITDGEHKTPRRVSSFCGYYLLSARNITNNLIKLDDVDYVDEEEYNIISKRCNPKRNDVLISCSGSIGRCCVVEDDNKYVMVRSAAMVSLININPKWIMYCIHSNAVQKQIAYKAKATAQANLFQEPIKNLIVPLPPLAEQKRIADVLERVLGV